MLRDYQSSLITKISNSNVSRTLAVMPCGAGKTVCMSHIANDFDGPDVAIAHRQELVMQISLAFGLQGIHHRIIAPDRTIEAVKQAHMRVLKKCWVRPDAHTGVAGVDTLIRRPDDAFLQSCELWQIDEAHHIQPDNKWGKAIALLKKARRGVGWTATPSRMDRKGLDESFDELIEGPGMRELIERGYLADYEIYGLPQAINTRGVKVDASGEFNAAQLAAAAQGSAITGDIVEHYLRICPGKKGATFLVDVKSATATALAYREAGVKAAVLHAKTPGPERIEIMRAMRGGDLMQVCNVDMWGEGADVPALECVSMGRPTMSRGLYEQQFCRCLRPYGDKVGVILDHVGNVGRHGLPDAPRVHTLAGGRRNAEPTIRITTCGNPECMRVHDGYEPACPFCGWTPERGDTSGREAPEQLAGDLTLYTPELLAHLRAEAARIAGGVIIPPGLRGGPAASRLTNMWRTRKDAQAALREAIDQWAGRWVHVHGESIQATYRRFHHAFGVDTLKALTQSGPEMAELMERIQNDRTGRTAPDSNRSGENRNDIAAE